ncbi:PRC-barrel domain-containing protein [Microvirga splendida]|uniref:PRC-barrel domain-containing protein n=1 Tax=Microvirga splendida TaxID=2795727 RepID=A0ABS0Y469_9HYPH|nr:PRC-barrel domain-containing protein [Microvirga splendida]MBJ6127096.1 PRC-barrel domain-containing protein [Microvirga splendida]
MRLAKLTVFLSATALVPLSATAQQQNQQQAQPRMQQAQSGQQQNQQGLRASQLRNQTLYTQAGQEMGRVNTIVQGRDNQTYAVVASGDRQVLVPANRLSYRNNRFMISGNANQSQFEAYNRQVAGQYRELEDNYRLAIVGYDVDPVVAARPENDGTNVVVRQAAPTVRVDPADPRVIVRQQQPQVTVNQAQPEILVRQPQPTVRVDIPQPEIIVRMPQPDVNVAMQQPDVRVLMQRPDVSVVQPGQPQVQVAESQPQVMLQRSANSEPNVQVMQAEGQPTVRYERAQPRVVVNQAQGQPNVRFERQGEANVNVQQQNRSAGMAGSAAMNVAMFDRDRDNAIARDEFNPFVDRVYTGWDANRNQRLERNEFYGSLYNVWDTDLDSRLTEDEYNQAWDTWGSGLNDVEFGEFDRNGDGILDRNEFAGGWGDRGLYERWDADRTGWLAENEFGNGLFGLWGERDRIATNDFQPWVGRNWGIGGTQTAAVDTNTFEPRRDPVDTGAVDATANVRPFAIRDLEDMDVYSLRGQQIGEVKRVVRRLGDNRSFVILEHGGFLGLGEKEVPIPLNRVFMMGDRLVAAGLTEAEVEAMRDWDFNDREYSEIGDNETVEIGLRG